MTAATVTTRRAQTFRTSSRGMIVGRLASMLLGFLFWLVAARLFSTGLVGITAATVSAMMLCTQLANLGLGPTLVTRLAHSNDPRSLIFAAIMLSTGAAVVVSGLALFGSQFVQNELDRAARSPTFSLLFVLITVLGTLNILLDHISMSVGRGTEVLIRNVVFGSICVGGIGVVRLADGHPEPSSLFAPWVVGATFACLIGLKQVASAFPNSPDGDVKRFEHRRPSQSVYSRRTVLMERSDVKRLVRVGLGNHALTLSDRLPALMLPVAVATVAGSEQAAYWYTAWMIAWAVQIVPASIGVAMLAEGARSHDRHNRLRSLTNHDTFRWALRLGIGAAIAVTVFAPILLSILGSDYEAVATTPLRILVWCVVPATFLQTYISHQRLADRFRSTTIILASTGIFGVVATVLALQNGAGLQSAAVIWVAVQGAACGLLLLVDQRKLHRVSKKVVRDTTVKTAGVPTRFG